MSDKPSSRDDSVFPTETAESAGASLPPARPPYPEPQNSSSEAMSSPLSAAPAGNPVGAFMEPPPSYQAAMAYPSAATHAQPASNPAYPKNPPAPPRAAPGYPTNYGAYPHPEPVYPTQLPQPPATAAIVVNVSPVGVLCSCGGIVMKETDMCCLMCLIFLAIFTFPFGLFLLCCIPCTVRHRCSSCRRIL